jgi:uncharacterized phage protein gp47/JayE
MALDLPESASEIISRSQTDVQRQLPKSNPQLKNSWLISLIISTSNRIFDFYLQLKEAIKQTFFDTSTGIFLERQASWFGITRLAATQADGFIVITGTATSEVPNGTSYQSSDGIEYLTTSLGTVSDNSVSVLSVTRSGSTVTVKTTSDHNLASNVEVTMSGAVETQYNGAFAIKVTASDEFTYQIETTPTTPATGTILAGFTSGTVPVQSVTFGEVTNQVLDSVLSLQSPIVGIDDDANVGFNQLDGGTDRETDDALRLRFLDRVQNPIAHFNVAEITSVAKSIAGVTRVFVQEITPDIGQVTIYFTRDNDDDIIPTAGEVQDVKDAILTIKPANTSDANVIVSAPTPVTVDFTFGSVTPNTNTMKAAVKASLEQFFLENTSVGVDVQKVAYDSAIFNTVDSTGAFLQGFSLSIPAGDIPIASNEIALLGNVLIP